MNVCVYACMYVCMYVCMYIMRSHFAIPHVTHTDSIYSTPDAKELEVCVLIDIYVLLDHICVCVCVCMCVLCACVCAYVCMCMCVCMCVCCVHVCAVCV